MEVARSWLWVPGEIGFSNSATKTPSQIQSLRLCEALLGNRPPSHPSPNLTSCPK